MASTNPVVDLLHQASLHFSNARPFIPMYIHLVLSALFPIYTGAHASLSRPSSAAKPDKKTKKLKAEDEDEDEDEEQVQKMEGLSNKDAIVLPVTAAIVLGGLYFLIMRYGADLINLIAGYYFSAIGVYSIYKLVNDAANVLVSFIFPIYYADGGTLWQIISSERKAMPYGGDYGETADLPIPIRSKATLLPHWVKDQFWWTRSTLRQKYTIYAYIHSMLELCTNVTVVNVLSASAGVGTIVYVNTVSKLWFLTNLQGFAVSYSALQLMSPTTFSTGSLILGALFCYDIWAVFFTPLMVTVAKNLDVPIKLVFPRPDEPSDKPGEPPIKSFSMLGLGDIVLPGIMIGLALRFDLYMFYLQKQKTSSKTSIDPSSGEAKTEEVTEMASYVSPVGRWGDRMWTYRLPASSLPPHLRTSFPKPYFTASIIGYIVGMLATLGVMSIFQHAQPALLYLVPGVLVSLWGTGLVRGGLKEMWEFSEAVTAEQAHEDSAKEKTGEDGKEAESKNKKHKGLFERLWQEIWSSEKEADDQTKSTGYQSGGSSSADKAEKKASRDSKLDRKQKEENDLLISLSISRYNPRSSAKSKSADSKTPSDVRVEDTHSHSGSQSSDDAVVVSSADLDGTNESESAPRYRTRSMRSAGGKSS